MSPNQGWVEPPPPQPGYQPPPAPGQPGQPAAATFTCPKCRGEMRTYNRNSIHIEQCLNCRGIFLDFGELENLTRLEGHIVAPVAPPPAQGAYGGGYGPGWGSHGGHRYRKQGFGRLFFSS